VCIERCPHGSGGSGLYACLPHDKIFASTSYTNVLNETEVFEEIKRNDYFALLKFLLYRGFIDETYADYMTYYYEDRISANDKIYLRRITDRRGADYTYQLKEPLKVLSSSVLRIVDFNQEETLNFDLFDCLLQNRSNALFGDYLETLVNQVKSNSKFEFISMFYERESSVKDLVICINTLWPEFFSLALSSKELPITQIRQYSIDTLYYSQASVIIKVNIGNCLSTYISESSDYLSIINPDIEKLIGGFSLINVSFTSLDYEQADNQLFNAVYTSSLYEITFENVAQILKVIYKVDNEEDIAHKNYTLVRSKRNSPLDQYIALYISKYLDTLIDNCDGRIDDDENMVIDLLNNEELSDEAKTKYIEVLSTPIASIMRITQSDLWPLLLDRALAVSSVDNVVAYYSEYKIDTHLRNFINALPDNVDFSTYDYEDGLASSIFNSVSTNNGISSEKYRKILMDLDCEFEEFEESNISDSHIKILIAENLLKMGSNGLTFIRTKYKGNLYAFIQHNLDEYLEFMAKEIFILEEALEVITWDFDDAAKIKLIRFTNEPIAVDKSSYSDAETHILFKTITMI
jgi:hypothetical protein